MTTPDDIFAYFDSPSFQAKPLRDRKSEAEKIWRESGLGRQRPDPVNNPGGVQDYDSFKARFLEYAAPTTTEAKVQDINTGVRVALQSAARALPSIPEDIQNVARFATGGEKSIIPKADYTSKILPELATPEERQARWGEAILGSLPAYAVGGVATKALTKVPKVASLLTKTPAALKTVVKAIYPLAPVKNVAANIPQAVVGGVESAISEAVKKDETPTISDVAVRGAAGGLLTGAGILGGKVLGAAAEQLPILKGLKDVEAPAVKDIEAPQARGSVQAPKQRVAVADEVRQLLEAQKPAQEAVEETGDLVGKTVKDLEVEKAELTKAKGDPKYWNKLRAKYEAEDIKAEQVLPKKAVQKIQPIEKSFTLPQVLKQAKPRYRDKLPIFESDLDRAAYILAQENRSRADALYLQEVMKHTGWDEAQARAYGREVKQSLKTHYQNADPNADSFKVPFLQKQQTASVLPPKRQIEAKITERQRVNLKQRQARALKREAEGDLESIALQKPTKTQKAKTVKAIKQIKKSAKETKTQVEESVKGRQPILPKKKVLKGKVSKTQVEDPFEYGSGPLLTITGGPIKRAVRESANSLRTIGAKVWLEPLRLLKNDMPDVVNQIRADDAKVDIFATQVAPKWINALAEFSLKKEDLLPVGKVLESIKLDDIANNNVHVPNMDVRSGSLFDQNKALEATRLWQGLDSDAKGWAITLARMVKDISKFTDTEPEEMLASHFAKQSGIKEFLNKTNFGFRNTGTPSFVFKDGDGLDKTVDLPQLAIGYINSAKQKLLQSTIKHPTFKAAKTEALNMGRNDLANALDQVEANLTRKYSPGPIQQFLDWGLRSVFESTLRFNLKAGILNKTQTMKLMLPKVGTKIYKDSSELLADPLVRKYVGHVDIRRTPLARMSLERGAQEGIGIPLWKQLFSKTQDPNYPIRELSKDMQKRLLIDAFQSPEVYFNQPMAIIAGMLREVGGDKTALKEALQGIDTLISQGRTKEGYQVLSRLLGAGKQLNQEVNFVRVEADRPAYESEQLARFFLPFLNYKLKEAGYIMDTVYEGISGGMQAKLDMARTLGWYLGMKALVGGPKAALTLAIPAVAYKWWMDNDPESFRDWQETLEIIDEYGNLPKKYLKIDFSSDEGLLDFTMGLAFGLQHAADISQAPYPQALSSGIKGAFALAQPETYEGAHKEQLQRAAKGVAKFLPIPTLKGTVGKIPIEVAIGAGPVVRALEGYGSAKAGVKRIFGEDYPTTTGKEIRRQFGTTPEELAIYSKDVNRKIAERLIEKGVEPGPRLIQKLATAKAGEEAGQEEETQLGVKASLIDSLRTSYKESLFNSLQKGDDNLFNEMYDKLRDMGLTQKDIAKYLKEKYREPGKKAQKNKREKVEKVFGGLR